MGSRESGASRFSLGWLSFPSCLFTVHGSAVQKPAAQVPGAFEREGTEGFWNLSPRNLGPYLGSAGMKVGGRPACREAVLQAFTPRAESGWETAGQAVILSVMPTGCLRMSLLVSVRRASCRTR